MVKRFIMVTLALLTIGVQAFAQNVVTGRVVDAKGEPVPAAGVQVKGTNIGVITDLDGIFSVKAGSSTTLVISAIGYKTAEVVPGGRTDLNVVLEEDALLLDDVVVVAYGTARKRDLTGSISTVQNKTITSQAQGSVTRALEGAVPGLQTQAIDGQPGLDMGIRIRGIGTASPNNSNALIIIDGAPALESTNVLSSMNSQDIESITVLKDAASTALYGSRGANGVILVTTKSGKAGKTKVSFQSRVGINAMGGNSRFTKIGDKGAYEIYETYWESIYNDVYYGLSDDKSVVGNATAAAAYASAHLFDYTGTVSGGAPVYSRNGLGNRLAYKVPGMTITPTGTIGTTSASGTLSGAYLVNTDGKINPNAELLWSGQTADELITNRFRQEYTVSASGATDKVDYHVSAGYLSDPSYIQTSSFDRYTARANVNAKVTEWLKAGAKFSFTHRETNSQPTRWGRNPGYVTQNAFTWVDTATELDQMYVRDENGNILYNTEGEKVINVNWGRNYPNVGNTYSPLGFTTTQWSYNLPLFYKEAHDTMVYDDMTSNGYIRASFLKYFTAEANINYSKTNTTRTRFWNTHSAHSMNGLADSMGSAIWKQMYTYQTLNSQQLVNYSQNFDKHHVDAMVGHEFYTYYYESINYGSGHSLIDDFEGPVNFLGTQTYSTFGGTVGSGKDKYAMESYLSRANYNFDEKYYLSASLRRDGSSKFKLPENRWGTFWSVGAGWRVSAEPFMDATKSWLDNLKVRASYGVIGNQNGIGYHSGYQTWAYSVATWAGSGLATYPSATNLKKNNWVNDALTWEHVNTTDLGVEFTLLGGKISGNVDWFQKHTKDAFWDAPVSFLAAGQATLQQNTAGIRSRGVEFEFNYQPIKTDDWDLILSLNGTHFKNILTNLPQGDDYTYTAGAEAWSQAGGGSITAVEYLRGVGKSYYNMYLYKYGGVAGNPGKTYFGDNGTEYTGFTSGDPYAGRALFYHRVTQKDLDGGLFAGKAVGDEVLTTNSKLIGDGDRYEMGDAIPALYGGFSVNARWKNFDLSIMLGYQIGGKFLSVDYASAEAGKYMTGVNLNDNGGAAMTRELMGNTWSETNQSAKFPMLHYTGSAATSGANLGSWAYTDLALFDASYLSVKNITLGYTLPKKIAQRAKMSGLRVYASADNSMLFYGHSGIDPRWCLTGGMEVGAYSYPSLAVYTFGVNIDF